MIFSDVAVTDAGELAKLAGETYDVVISISQGHDFHQQNVLFEYVRLLKPGGSVVLREPILGRTFEMSERVSSALTLSGFVNTKVGNVDQLVEVRSSLHIFFPFSRMLSSSNFLVVVMLFRLLPASPHGALELLRASQSRRRTPFLPRSGTSLRTISSMRPRCSAKRTDRSLPQSVRVTSFSFGFFFCNPHVRAYTMAYVLVVADDCEVGTTKKACKNCSCGRAEEEAAGQAPKKKLTLDMIENPGVNSSCGSVRFINHTLHDNTFFTY
jgi:SAM-dependent methyltransferase